MKKRRWLARLLAGVLILGTLSGTGMGSCVQADEPKVDETSTAAQASFASAEIEAEDTSAAQEAQLESAEPEAEVIQNETASLSQAVSLKGRTYEVQSTGDYAWKVVEKDGRLAASSGNAGVDRSTSTMSVSVTVEQKCNLIFYYIASSESKDSCEFYLNGERKLKTALGSLWMKYQQELEPGNYTLEWRYVKDSSGSSWDDAFYVRDLYIGKYDPMADILTDYDTLEVPLNSHVDMPYEIVPLYPDFRNVSVTAADPTIVTVQNKANSSYDFRLHGNKVGTTTVTITSLGYSGVSRTFSVTVVDSGCASVEIYGIAENVEVGDQTYSAALMKVREDNVRDPEFVQQFPFVPDCMTYADGALCGYKMGYYFRADLEDAESISLYKKPIAGGLHIDSVAALCHRSADGMLYGIGQSSGGFWLLKINPYSGAAEKLRKLDPALTEQTDPSISWIFGITDGPDGIIRTVAYVKYDKDGSETKNDFVYAYNPETEEMTCGILYFTSDKGKDVLVYDAGNETFWDLGDGLRNVDLTDYGGENLGGRWTLSGAFMVSQDASDISLNPFTDVKEGKFYYDAVLWAYYADPQITTGKKADQFDPKGDCTRQQVVTFLWRLAGCPEPLSGENPFEDVAEGTPYYKAILWAYENGITTGTSETTFDPKGKCTRRDFVTFLWRTYGEPKHNMDVSPFRDVTDDTKYWYDPIMWAVDNEITTGKYPAERLFAPKDTLTRGEVVTFIFRAYLTKGRP